MDTGELIALLSIVGSFALLALIVGGAWALGRLYERRHEITRGAGHDDLGLRLARIEHMLDTLSTDVERIADERSQRLLSNK